MQNSLFHKDAARRDVPTPYELIEPEIVHLKKGYSIRHGAKGPKKTPPWLAVLAFLGLAWLYLMDPVIHAWYKGEAIRTYLYLHNYSNGPEVQKLVDTHLLSPSEIATLNSKSGSYQDYYPSPQTAAQQASTIIDYMNRVKLLHAGKYQQLDPVGRMRYLLFIRTKILLPISWDFLDPAVSE